MYDYAHKFINDVDNLQMFVNGLYELETNFEWDCSLDRFKRIYDNVSALNEPVRTGKFSEEEQQKRFEREYQQSNGYGGSS